MSGYKDAFKVVSTLVGGENKGSFGSFNWGNTASCGSLSLYLNQDNTKLTQLTADNKSVLMMKESVGADLSRLAGEIDKLAIALPVGSVNITPELVEEHIGISKEYNNFELQNALVNKDILKANKIINYFAQNPKKNPIQMTLALLFGFFSNVMMCYYAPDKSERGVAEFLGLRSTWGVGDYIKAMRNYKAVHVLEILHLIRLADAQSKGAEGPQTTDGEIMRELLYRILH
jgi:DNA polymerase-3 subunit delta